MKTRTDVINSFIREDSRYLEIGVQSGKNFRKIECSDKISVDPNPAAGATFQMPSDEFFEKNTEIFDVVFIDGLHLFEQVLRDILNALDCLSDGGVIICHDLDPKKEWHQDRTPPWERREVISRAWTGDCWKAWAMLRGERPDLFMYVIDVDWGCGVIQRGTQELIKLPDDLDWNYFVENRKRLLNLMPPQGIR